MKKRGFVMALVLAILVSVIPGWTIRAEKAEPPVAACSEKYAQEDTYCAEVARENAQLLYEALRVNGRIEIDEPMQEEKTYLRLMIMARQNGRMKMLDFFLQIHHDGPDYYYTEFSVDFSFPANEEGKPSLRGIREIMPHRDNYPFSVVSMTDTIELADFTPDMEFDFKVNDQYKGLPENEVEYTLAMLKLLGNVLLEASDEVLSGYYGIGLADIGFSGYGESILASHVCPEGTVTKAATGTRCGYCVGTCSYCGKEGAVEILPALFEDVYPGQWFFDSVDYVCENKIMNGMNPTTFNPGGNLARAQFANVIYHMEGDPETEYARVFPDVADGVWYTKPIIWANQAGIVFGSSETGLFDPAGNITRAQMAAMMFRYANYKGYDTTKRESLDRFPDAASVQSFAVEPLSWAVAEGIITGKYEGTRLDPNGKASRAECATVIMRFLKKYWN